MQSCISLLYILINTFEFITVNWYKLQIYTHHEFNNISISEREIENFFWSI